VDRRDEPDRPDKIIGPFSLSSGEDGRWSLDVGLAMQLRFTAVSQLTGEAGELLDTLVEARRIRPTLSGRLFSKDLRFFLHLSTAPGSVEFMDWYLDYRFSQGLSARVGQWKIPFTRFRTGSFKNLTFNDWPVVTTYFGAERQMGLALHNGYTSPPRLQFEAGLFSGVNARASHAVGLARLYGDEPPNPSDLIDPAPRASLHPELVVHLAYNHGGIDSFFDSDFVGGPLRFSAGISAAWDLDPSPTEDLALRLAPEVLIKVEGLSAFGALYLGWDRAGDSVSDQRQVMVGGVIQTSYLVTRRLEVSARYAFVHTSDELLDDARDRAERILAAAKDAAQAQQLTARYSGAGRIQLEQEATVGLNVYLVGRSLKWQTDLGWIARTLRDAWRRSSIRLRSQLQLAF
jgi:hypothetical protein